MQRRREVRSARRRWVWATIATVSAAIVAFVSLGAAHSRAEAADRLASRAAGAVDAARGADARRWATDELTSAEESLRLGAIERRRQDIRWWIPNYQAAEGHWRAAEVRATEAASMAAERRRHAEATAHESIVSAEGAIAASSRLSSSIYGGTSQRAALSEARLRLGEARIYLRNGDFTHAARSADLAFALTQRTNAHTTAAVARYADDG
ncbi:MAG TPA: hypothetical protein VMM93_02030, partial [Vicinamibacterales bacterium]|nr:hypothetical protein [Vicinamibacterales bacterium]